MLGLYGTSLELAADSPAEDGLLVRPKLQGLPPLPGRKSAFARGMLGRPRELWGRGRLGMQGMRLDVRVRLKSKELPRSSGLRDQLLRHADADWPERDWLVLPKMPHHAYRLRRRYVPDGWHKPRLDRNPEWPGVLPSRLGRPWVEDQERAPVLPMVAERRREWRRVDRPPLFPAGSMLQLLERLAEPAVRHHDCPTAFPRHAVREHPGRPWLQLLQRRLFLHARDELAKPRLVQEQLEWLVPLGMLS
ncbi:hypothetical protein [Mumia zhuanghuii]|uniref:Uncharacterized protein n=1 Tax=Mumia zhuanghuii TaxID=2585211 RepID=A0A5C4MBE3_9ACTN|nr:hypothetical protein [Mumia zhuanghuii]TNC33520.1 hypothetical protein FHE65_28945 [Mumia zhuanghuii]